MPVFPLNIFSYFALFSQLFGRRNIYFPSFGTAAYRMSFNLLNSMLEFMSDNTENLFFVGLCYTYSRIYILRRTVFIFKTVTSGKRTLNGRIIHLVNLNVEVFQLRISFE